LDRCFFGPHARDKGGALLPKGLRTTSIMADQANSGIQVGDIMLRALPAYLEGTGAPEGFWKNPDNQA
jgi:hypothetical protein